jgi:hypothetical protein
VLCSLKPTSADAGPDALLDIFLLKVVPPTTTLPTMVASNNSVKHDPEEQDVADVALLSLPMGSSGKEPSVDLAFRLKESIVFVNPIVREDRLGNST